MTDKAPTGAKSGTAACTASTQAPSGRSTQAPRISSVRPRQLTPAEAALLPPENVMEAGGNFYEHPNASAKRRRLNEPSSADKDVSCKSPATPRPKLPDLTKETMPSALLGIGLVYDEDAPIKQEPDLPVPTPVSPQYPSRSERVLQDQSNVSPEIRIKQEEMEAQLPNPEVQVDVPVEVPAEVPPVPAQPAGILPSTSSAVTDSAASSLGARTSASSSTQAPLPETSTVHVPEVTLPAAELPSAEAPGQKAPEPEVPDFEPSKYRSDEGPMPGAVTPGAESPTEKASTAETEDVEMPDATSAKIGTATEENFLEEIETAETFQEVVLEAPDYADCDLQDIPQLKGRIERIIGMRSEPNSVEPHYLVRMVGASNLIVVPQWFFSWTDEHKKCLAQFVLENAKLERISLSDYEKENRMTSTRGTSAVNANAGR